MNSLKSYMTEKKYLIMGLVLWLTFSVFMVYSYKINWKLEINQTLKIFFLMLYIIMTLVMVTIYVMYVKQRRPEWIFAITVFVMGMVYLFVIPPYAVPDETVHFITAYAQSSTLLGEQVLDESGKVIVEHPGLWGNDKSIPDKQSYMTYLRGIIGNTKDQSNEKIATTEPLTMIQPGYVPQVIGISFARVIGMTSEQILLIGRIFALLWYCFIMFWAIKIIPFGKTGLMVIGMLPMTMQQVVSYNYDSVLFGICFFSIAYLVDLIYRREKVQIRDGCIVIIAAIAVAAIKFVYLPIFALALLISKSKFNDMKCKIIAGVTLVVTSGITVLVTKLYYFEYMAMSQAISVSGETVEKISIAFCVEHPIEIVKMFYRTLRTQLPLYMSEIVGSPLGWLEIWLPKGLVFVLLVVLLISMFADKYNEKIINWKIKVYSIFIVILISGLILGAILFDANCNNVNSIIIAGVQGRYFLPIIPLGILILENKFFSIKQNVNQYLILSMGFLQGIVVCYVSTLIVGR